MHGLTRGLRMGIALGSLAAMLIGSKPTFAVDIVDDPVQIDDRAAQLVQSSNSLCWEMFRYHKQQPDYAQAYRVAKELWSQGQMLRDALRTAPMETETLVQQVAQVNDLYAQLDKMLSKWGDGDRSMVPPGGPRTAVVPGVAVDVPFVGVRVGRPRMAIVDDGSPALDRRRLHPNSHGSKRSLERELAAVKVAVDYLSEDAGINATGAPPAPGSTAPSSAGPVPNPPEPGSNLGEPVKVNRSSAKSNGGTK